MFEVLAIPNQVLSDEEIIRMWKFGLTKIGVAKNYCKNFNKYKKSQDKRMTQTVSIIF